MTAGHPDGLRARKRRATRERIGTVAIGLFGERGFDQTTVDDIAAAAEVSRATVFRYFGSKDDIVYGIEDELLEFLRSVLRGVPPPPLAEAVVRYAQHVDDDVPQLRDRAAVISSTARLVDRFAHTRARWDLVVADELARREGRATAAFEDHVRSAAAMSALFVSFLSWAITPGSTLTQHVRKAIKVVPVVFEAGVGANGRA